ncbi:ultraviolet-B receptor UVR8-like isoform X2 [Amaranthus tricolor]|uniref:ultraviolet-B receptor UVR8-like isoform X2 n=1 Tax=Amaranthus tricolor TaxID=29722 RepID=UPI0025860BB6|nr:ultraviolet-B receptor UVR8-like isoform X2 [Amaranthus tricolor]
MGTQEKDQTFVAEAAKEERSSNTHQNIRQILLISAGASHSVALLSGNVVCSWGKGEDGQLGHGDAEDRFSPVQLSALDGHEVNSITCGADHTLAYSEPRLQVYSWGWGDFGRLGHGNSSDLFIPHPIKALGGNKIKQIACGDSHCLAITMDGEVASWGRNQNGQLGIGTTEDCQVPQKIQVFQGIPVKMVAAGAEHSAAVTEAGEVYGWGWGRYGNLGLGDRNDRLVPEKVSSIDFGQVGVGDYTDRCSPVQVSFPNDQKVLQICCGWRHTLAVTERNNVFSWGRGTNGQLGHGDSVDRVWGGKDGGNLYP